MMVFAKSHRRGRLRWLGGGSPEKDGPENEHAPEGAGFGCCINVGPSGANRFCTCAGLGASAPS